MSALGELFPPLVFLLILATVWPGRQDRRDSHSTQSSGLARVSGPFRASPSHSLASLPSWGLLVTLAKQLTVSPEFLEHRTLCKSSPSCTCFSVGAEVMLRAGA